MDPARFRVVAAGPLVTIQDAGRPGNMRYGVPASGPMDRVSQATANLSVGNAKDESAIEVSMGGLKLECLAGEVSMSAMGKGFIVDLDGVEFEASAVFSIKPGQTLSIRPGKRGSWCYLAFAGKIKARHWLQKTATHSQSGMGGGLLTSGQEVLIEEAEVRTNREGPVEPFAFRNFDGYARVVLGPQDNHFEQNAIKTFLGSEFSLTTGYDRMGMRLEGSKLQIKKSLSIPSEPIVKGSIQVNGDGVATILLADHQTTGGYPKIATVITADHDAISQLRPRQKIRFKAISPEDAIKIARIRAVELKYYLEGIR